MIVLDASALIAFLNPADALHSRAVAAVLSSRSGDLGVSVVTHAEVLVGPARAGTLRQTRAALEALGVTELGLPEDAASQLAELRVTTALKLPDCCVVLAAQDAAAELLTFDDRLAGVARGLGIELAS